MHPVRSAAHQHRRALMGALLLGAAVLVIEVVAGIASHSVALLADAGHVFADASGIGLSALAIEIAHRQPTSSRSFGLYRLEIVAAAINALLLLGIATFVIWEGIRRVGQPAEVHSGLMIGVAIVALAANIGSMAILRHGQAASLTLRGAYLEVLSDALGSALVLAAGIVIAVTGFGGADGVAALMIGVLILPRTWRLLRDSVDVLLEATPKDVDLTAVRRHILDAPGVAAVHDLHAWTITSGMNVVSAHVVLTEEADPGRLIDHLSDCLAGDFDIDHSTFQLETPEHVIWEGQAGRTQH